LNAGRGVSLAVGLAVAGVGLLVVFAGQDGGQKGRGPAVGTQMPVFAAPLARSNLVGDVNISGNACRAVTDVRAFVSCPAVVKRSLAIGFIAADDPQCARLPAALQLLQSQRPRVQAVVVGIRGDRKPLADLAASSPGVDVVWDRDGALTNRYAIAVCPTVVFVRRGGQVAGSALGDGIDQAPTLVGKADSILKGG
jgi:hypothetical protein